MSVKEPTTEEKTEKNLEQESAGQLGQQASERITIEVLKQLIREHPKKVAHAATQSIQTSRRKLAALLLILGEDSARRIMAELNEHEKALSVSAVAGLRPVSLEEQSAILKEFTVAALRAVASLFGDPEFAKAITTPLPLPPFESSEEEK